jgi:hypothetical protein
MDTLNAVFDAWGLPQPIGYHLIAALICLWPLAHLFRRAGLAPWPAALALLVPFIGPAIALSFLAFQRWPVMPPPPPKRVRRQKQPNAGAR